MNRLTPILAARKLCVLPRVLERFTAERSSRQEELLISVTLKVAFDLVSPEDGSRHTVEVYGEALDRGDKVTAKALTAAYKTAMLQTFCVPVTGSADADASSFKLKNVAASSIRATPLAEPVQGWEQWTADVKELISSCETTEALERVQDRNRALLRSLGREQPRLYAALGKAFADRRQEVSPALREPTPSTTRPPPSIVRKGSVASSSSKRSKANGAAAPVH
jgi:hypothetical protein